MKGYTTTGVNFMGLFIFFHGALYFLQKRGTTMAKINGEEISQANGMTVSEYITLKNYNQNNIAVECNGCILPKSDYSSYNMAADDKIEIVSFVGGG